MTRPAVPRRERGFALLIVLWTMALLALLTTRLVATGRTETRLAANLRAAAVAEAAADGAVHAAAFRVFAGQWEPAPFTRTMRIGTATVEVLVENEGCKLNPTYSPVALVQALLEQVGTGGQNPAALAWAILSFRTPGSSRSPLAVKAPQYLAAGRPYGPSEIAFQSLDEIGLVLGVTPDLLARLTPHLSVYNNGTPDESCASAEVRAAIDDARARGIPVNREALSEDLVVRITAAATAPGGRFVRRATVRFPSEPVPEEPTFRIVTWEAPSL